MRRIVAVLHSGEQWSCHVMSRRYCFTLDPMASEFSHPSTTTNHSSFNFFCSKLVEPFGNNYNACCFYRDAPFDLASMKSKASSLKTNFLTLGYSHFVINMSLSQLSQRRKKQNIKKYFVDKAYVAISRYEDLGNT